jgi:hypothetical protein
LLATRGVGCNNGGSIVARNNREIRAIDAKHGDYRTELITKQEGASKERA